MNWAIIKGILLAQLGLPLSFCLSALATGMVPLSQPSALFAVAFTSMFGLILSLPLSLLVGLPIARLLVARNKLNVLYILPLSLFIPTGLILVTQSISSLSMALPATLLGALVFSWYASTSIALTNHSN